MSELEFFMPSREGQPFFTREWSHDRRSNHTILLTSFTATRELSEDMLTDHTFKAWEGLFHELHNEIVRKKILGYLKE
ncbi:MAG: hypothetical protein Q8M08_06885 [Bacteroidales bacterium]|nr:hypothetical protein [Bacteroidales bacterium]